MKKVKLFEQYVAEAEKFKSTKDFEDFCEEIDGMPESRIKKIMGKDYIDTPGGYRDEAEDYDNDIIEYMISNMGRKDFEELKSWWENNVAESVVNETGFKKSDIKKTIDFINKEIGIDPGYALIGDEEDIEEFDKLWDRGEYEDAFDFLTVATNMEISTLDDVKNAIKESKVTEAKAKGLDWITGELGDKPKCFAVASFVYNNYDKVTGLKKSMRNDEMDFPQEIMDVVDHYGLDIDEFTDCYGMAAESKVTEGEVNLFDEVGPELEALRTKISGLMRKSEDDKWTSALGKALSALSTLDRNLSQADSKLGVVPVTEGVVSIKGGRIIAHKVLNKLVDMGLIPVKKKSEELLETIAEVITNAKMESVGVNEGSMSDIDLMAQEAKDFKSFVKEFTKTHHDLSKAGEPGQFETWLKSVYDTAKENMDESVVINENDMTKDYGGFIVLDMKTKKSYKFKYIKGVKSVNVENDAIAKLMKSTGESRGNFMVNGLIRKGEWDKSEFEVLESKVNEAYGKPAGLSKDETLKVAQKFAEAISKADGTKCTVNTRTLEEDSFDLDCDGEEFDGGSYNIYQNGDVMNMAISSNPVYGKKNDTVDTIVKNVKKLK